MRKSIKIALIVCTIIIVLTPYFLWASDILFFRVSQAKVINNEIVPLTYSVYKSENQYLVFFEEGGQSRTYVVFSDRKEVGIPNAPIPSSFTKSIKKDWFVFCGNCSAALAGTIKFSGGIQEISLKEIRFYVDDNHVDIQFNE